MRVRSLRPTYRNHSTQHRMQNANKDKNGRRTYPAREKAIIAGTQQHHTGHTQKSTAVHAYIHQGANHRGKKQAAASDTHTHTHTPRPLARFACGAASCIAGGARKASPEERSRCRKGSARCSQGDNKAGGDGSKLGRIFMVCGLHLVAPNNCCAGLRT